MRLLEIMKQLKRCAAELSAPIALAALALGLWSFAHIAEEVGEGETHGFDSAILLWLRHLPQSVWAQQTAIDLTALGGYAVLTLWVSAAALYLIVLGKKQSALVIVSASACGALLSEGLKLGFARPRPDLVEHWALVQSASFPSGHAMLSAIVYLSLGMLLAQLQQRRSLKILTIGLSILITLLVGLSRIYLGVHWPTDVIAGWALGAAWASLWWLIALKLQGAPLLRTNDARNARVAPSAFPKASFDAARKGKPD